MLEIAPAAADPFGFRGEVIAIGPNRTKLDNIPGITFLLETSPAEIGRLAEWSYFR